MSLRMLGVKGASLRSRMPRIRPSLLRVLRNIAPPTDEKELYDQGMSCLVGDSPRSDKYDVMIDDNPPVLADPSAEQPDN